MACLKEAENRLAEFTEAVKRILMAARYAPTDSDQTALLSAFGETTEFLLGQVHRRCEAAAGQSVMDRNAVARALGLEVGKVRARCRHEFELMLVDCAHTNAPVVPSVSVVYNLIGHNPRITHGGVDASTNTINVSAAELFS
jgi:hypothetical protein